MSARDLPPPTSALQKLVRDNLAEREARYPDLAWAERIVEQELRGQRPNAMPLKMAREALADAFRLKQCEQDIRDKLAKERS